MKRKLFFLFDKLKITRNERIAITVLMVLMSSFLLANTFVGSPIPFNKKSYQKVDNQFQKRTAVLKHKEQMILVRYRGNSDPQTALAAGSQDTVSLLASKIEEPNLDIGEKVNINKAGPEELQSLPGIGAAYAQNIIRYRKENGPFKTSSDLLNVNGIGQATLNDMKPFITLGNKKVIRDDSLAVTHHQNSSVAAASNKEVAISNPSINVNTASAEALQSLPGIGAAYSQRIIKYRRKHGAFKTIHGLLKIKGIGPATLHKIKPFVSIGDSTVKADSTLTKKLPDNKIPQKEAVKNRPCININTANAQKLQKLQGIGPALSQRIIAYRQKHGPFKTKNALLKIKGIGKKTLAKIKPFIKLRE